MAHMGTCHEFLMLTDISNRSMTHHSTEPRGVVTCAALPWL